MSFAQGLGGLRGDFALVGDTGKAQASRPVQVVLPGWQISVRKSKRDLFLFVPCVLLLPSPLLNRSVFPERWDMSSWKGLSLGKCGLSGLTRFRGGSLWYDLLDDTFYSSAPSTHRQTERYIGKVPHGKFSRAFLRGS